MVDWIRLGEWVFSRSDCLPACPRVPRSSCRRMITPSLLSRSDTLTNTHSRTPAFTKHTFIYYLHVHMHTHIHSHTYIHHHTHIFIHTPIPHDTTKDTCTRRRCTFIRTRAHLRVHACVCVHACVHVCMRVFSCMRLCACVYMYFIAIAHSFLLHCDG